MADTTTQLQVRDATGSIKILSGVSSSNGIATYHALTGTVAFDISSSLNYGSYSAAKYLSDIASGVSNLDTGDLPGIDNKLAAISSSVNYNSTSSARYLSDIRDVNVTASSYMLGDAGPALTAADLVNGITHTLSFIPASQNTKGVMFYNHTDADVYVRINGIPTASNGTYSFVIAPSGSKDILDPRYCKFSFYFTGSTNTTGYFTFGSFT